MPGRDPSVLDWVGDVTSGTSFTEWPGVWDEPETIVEVREEASPVTMMARLTRWRSQVGRAVVCGLRCRRGADFGSSSRWLNGFAKGEAVPFPAERRDSSGERGPVGILLLASSSDVGGQHLRVRLSRRLGALDRSG